MVTENNNVRMKKLDELQQEQETNTLSLLLNNSFDIC